MHAWQQTYPPGETEMSIRYLARPAFSPMERDSPALATYLHDHCANATDLEAILSRQLFRDSADLLVTTYVIPFWLSEQNLQQATLNFAPALADGTVSFVCTNVSTGTVARGEPNIAGQEIDSQGRAISVLTISGR